MNKKAIINFLGFIISGLISGVAIIFVSELTKFSHLNLLPFGGYSWAVWVYPIAIGVSFGFSSLAFKIKKPIFIFLGSLILSLIIFYFVFNGLLFFNPFPFGINARSF